MSASCQQHSTMRLCILDPHPRKEGTCVARMFNSALNSNAAATLIETTIYVIQEHIWPAPAASETSTPSPALNNNNVNNNNTLQGLSPLQQEIREFCLTKPSHSDSKYITYATLVSSYIVQNFDGVAISGSSDSVLDFYKDTLPYLPLLKLVIEQLVVKYDFPLLGICFGAQALAATIYGQHVMKRLKDKEFGFKTFTILDQEFELFKPVATALSDKPLGPSFNCASCHEDCFDQVYDPSIHQPLEPAVVELQEQQDKEIEANKVTNKLVTVCSSTQWYNQAFRVQGKRAFAMQFHPEFLKENAEAIYDRKRAQNVAVVHDVSSGPDASIGLHVAHNFFRIMKEARTKE